MRARTCKVAMTPPTLPSSRFAMGSLLRQVSIAKTPVRHFVHSAVSHITSNAKTTAKEMTFTAIPLPGETRCNFKERVHKTVTETVFTNAHAGNAFMMFYPTRIAKQHETVANVKMKTDLPLVNKPLLTGHCLTSYLNEHGQSCNDHTVSIRPDTSKSPIYEADVAPDSRLPTSLIEKISVWPAKHTSASEEIRRWADDAYYAHFVHSSRTAYPLHCFFKPLSAAEKMRYIEAVNDVKLTHTRYSLLDHMHPYTGKLDGQVVSGQNCTGVVNIAEKMTPVNIKNALGVNPTPQLVKNIFKKYYLGVDTLDLNSDQDELSRKYTNAL